MIEYKCTYLYTYRSTSGPMYVCIEPLCIYVYTYTHILKSSNVVLYVATLKTYPCVR